ncbi:MAG: LysR family transcriptional regulator [Myxococcota bacterium]
MDHWNELRTAFAVARLGTVSAAATELGLHRATVVRHVEALEAALGGRLFQRHARGYTPTEAGADLLRVTAAADAQFRELALRTRGRRSEVSGEVIVTSVDVVAPLVLTALRRFAADHPDTRLRFETSNRVFALEYGEAHVGVRTGAVTDDPDNVVQPWLTLRSALYAHRAYVDAHGLPRSADALRQHALIGDDSWRHLPSRWLRKLLPEPSFALSSRDERIHFRAIRAALGIGFMPVQVASAEPDLVQVLAPRPEWDLPFWLVTHVDLHWTAKVQAVLRALKAVGAASS